MLIKNLTVIALGVVAMAAAHAQEKTRAEVRQELIDLESVGYNPERINPDYPKGLEEAQRKLALKRANGQKSTVALDGTASVK